MLLLHSQNLFQSFKYNNTYDIAYVHCYTECPRMNVPDFGMVFLMLKYTDMTQNTYVQS